MNSKDYLEKFLLDSDQTNYLYINEDYKYDNNYFYKEKYNDRFNILYMRRYYPKVASNSNYEFAGYIDTKEHIIYNSRYNLTSILKEPKSIQFYDLGIIWDKLEKDIQENLKLYTLNNTKELEETYKDKFQGQKDYVFSNYQKDVERRFIQDIELDQIDLPSCSLFCYDNLFKELMDNIYTEYLETPKQIVSKYSEEILNNYENSKENLAMILLENNYKNEYLNEIINNKTKFKDIYNNREILKSIKDVDAINLNITITYDNESITFKFPKNDLVNSLSRADFCDSNYYSFYEPVKEFLKQHKKERTNDFDFSNITCITFGKKVLYEKELVQEKELDKDDDFEIEI